ncbi:Sulfotransferase, partial [Crocosphaera watsonii WH 0401]
MVQRNPGQPRYMSICVVILRFFMSTPKEPDFFSLDQNYTKGIEWYESLFEEAKPHQICGEASTTYSRSHQ